MASPFEHAWMLLKDSMDYGEIASGLPEPNPLDVALARARNQGPAPGANLKRLPPATMQDMDRMLQEKRGQVPLGQGVPPPQERMITDFNLNRQRHMENTSTGGLPIPNHRMEVDAREYQR